MTARAFAVSARVSREDFDGDEPDPAPAISHPDLLRCIRWPPRCLRGGFRFGLDGVVEV